MRAILLYACIYCIYTPLFYCMQLYVSAQLYKDRNNACKKKRHATNEKPDMFINYSQTRQYFIL